jgi:Cof subfamily protein (haloacid dehalogenase superfamily)
MAPALVAIDIDGTLTTADGGVSARTREALTRLRNGDVLVVLATGRPWQLAEPTVTSVGAAHYVICNNGAMSVRLSDGEVIRNVFLERELAPKVIKAVRDRLPAAGFALEFERELKAERGFRQRLPVGVAMGTDIEDVLTLAEGAGPVRKVLVFHDDYDAEISALVEVVAGAAGPSLLVSHSGLPFVEVGAPGLSKVAALAEICALEAVAAEDVVAFGDDVNDVEMLRWAGTGVAVGNAVPAAKAAADVIAGANVDDGVAAFLAEILIGTRRT